MFLIHDVITLSDAMSYVKKIFELTLHTMDSNDVWVHLQRAAATERYQISIEEMIHNEKQADIRREDDIQKKKEFEIHKVNTAVYAKTHENSSTVKP